MSSQNMVVGVETQVPQIPAAPSPQALIEPLGSATMAQFQSFPSQAASTVTGLASQAGLTDMLATGQSFLHQGQSALQAQASSFTGMLDSLTHGQASDLGTLVAQGTESLISALGEANFDGALNLQGSMARDPASSLLAFFGDSTDHHLDPATQVIQSQLEPLSGFGMSMGQHLDGGHLAGLISSLSGDLATNAEHLANGNFGASWAEASAPLPDLLTSLLSGSTGSADLGNQHLNLGDGLVPLNGLISAYTGADAPLQGDLHVQGGTVATPIHSLLDSIAGPNQQLPSISSVAHTGSAPVLPAGFGNLLGI